MSKVLLLILDGWGNAPKGPGNAVELARKPFFDQLWQKYPHTLLEASGEAVGLPAGTMGNSEVGHLNLGSGRQTNQDLKRINQAITDGSFFQNPVLLEAVKKVKENQESDLNWWHYDSLDEFKLEAESSMDDQDVIHTKCYDGDGRLVFDVEKHYGLGAFFAYKIKFMHESSLGLVHESKEGEFRSMGDFIKVNREVITEAIALMNGGQSDESLEK